MTKKEKKKKWYQFLFSLLFVCQLKFLFLQSPGERKRVLDFGLARKPYLNTTKCWVAFNTSVHRVISFCIVIRNHVAPTNKEVKKFSLKILLTLLSPSDSLEKKIGTSFT